MKSSRTKRESFKEHSKNCKKNKPDAFAKRPSKNSLSYYADHASHHENRHHIKDQSKGVKIRPKSSLGSITTNKMQAENIIHELEKNVQILKRIYRNSVSSLSHIQKTKSKEAKNKKGCEKVRGKKSMNSSHENSYIKQSKQKGNGEANQENVQENSKSSHYTATNLFEIYKFYKNSINETIIRKQKEGVSKSLKTSARNMEKKSNLGIHETLEKSRNTPSNSISSSCKVSRNNSTMVSKKLANSLEEEELNKGKNVDMKKKRSSKEITKSKKFKESKEKTGTEKQKVVKKTTKKMWEKKSNEVNVRATKKKGKGQHKVEELEEEIKFPEIQSSVFDKNLPILEEEPSNAEESRIGTVDKTGLFLRTDESGRGELEERIATSQQISFTLIENNGVRKKEKSSGEWESLEGCEIPKRDSDSSYLDNVELVSVQL